MSEIMNEEPEEFIYLESKDGFIVRVRRAIALQSDIISRALDVLGNLNGVTIPMSKIDGTTLKLMVEYMQFTENLEPWNGWRDGTTLPAVDRAFFATIETNQLVKLILAADYYVIQRFCDAGCYFAVHQFEGDRNWVIDEVVNSITAFRADEEAEETEGEENDESEGEGSEGGDDTYDEESDFHNNGNSGYDGGSSTSGGESSGDVTSENESTGEESNRPPDYWFERGLIRAPNVPPEVRLRRQRNELGSESDSESEIGSGSESGGSEDDSSGEASSGEMSPEETRSGTPDYSIEGEPNDGADGSEIDSFGEEANMPI